MGLSSWQLASIQSTENFIFEESKAVISEHSSEISSVGYSMVVTTPRLRIWSPYGPFA